jgi:hypothetical protein
MGWKIPVRFTYLKPGSKLLGSSWNKSKYINYNIRFLKLLLYDLKWSNNDKKKELNFECDILRCIFQFCWKPYFIPYWTSNTFFFFRIVHYVMEVTCWFLLSASKLFLILKVHFSILFYFIYFLFVKTFCRSISL